MAANENRIMALVVFSLYLTTVALGHNAPIVQWGHQLGTPPKEIRAEGIDQAAWANLCRYIGTLEASRTTIDE